jgi:hypothetical protein
MPAEPSGGAVTQLTEGLWVYDDRVVTVVVVDDEPTSDAASLRAAVEAALEPSFEAAFFDALRPYPGGWDPAEHHAVDQRVVVVHPSGAGSARFVGPESDPALAWVSANAQRADAAALAAATSRAIDAQVAPAGQPYRAIDSAASMLDLFGGQRSPADDHERALLASLGAAPIVRLLVATTRDDADATPASSFDLGGLAADGRIQAFVLAPSLPGVDPSLCEGMPPAGARLATWLKPVLEQQWLTWPCDSTTLQTNTLFPAFGYADYVCPTPPWPDLALPSGDLACRFLFETADTDPCDASRGMLDPVAEDGTRRPALGVTDAGTTRTCEIRQLTGAEGVACRTTLACDGCESGFCTTALPEIVDGRCGSSLRWVGGAWPTRSGMIHIGCDLPLPAPR